MENKEMFAGFDVMLGCSQRELEAYVGRPAVSYPSLKVYRRTSGWIAAVIDRDEKSGKEQIAAYALYDAQKKLVHAKNIAPVSAQQAAELPGDGLPLEEMVKKLGSGVLDIGSGKHKLVYLSDHLSLYEFKETVENRYTLFDMLVVK